MRWTGRSEGDARHRREGPARSWDEIVDRPVFWLHQVHRDGVVVVASPSDPPVQEGDALVTTRSDVALGVLTADCAPVALASPEGVVGGAHAGWAGLAMGILERTVEAMRSLGAGRVTAALGPCIHAECYQFATTGLDRLAGQFGDSVRGTTAAGTPSFDLEAGVAVALRRAGAHLVHRAGECTACAASPDVADGSFSHRDFSFFSHRARGERERQAMVVWRA